MTFWMAQSNSVANNKNWLKDRAEVARKEQEEQIKEINKKYLKDLDTIQKVA